MRKRPIIFSIAVLVILLCISPVNAEQPEKLTIGRATDNVIQEHGRLFPIAQYLASRLGAERKIEGTVYLDGQNSDQLIIKEVMNGNLHLVFESPFSAALYQKTCDMIPLVLVKREDLVEYKSYVFVRKDSEIETMDDLLGKKIAFEDPTSTSSFRWPLSNLTKMGYRFVPEGVRDSEAINYLFAGSELNVSSFVFYGKVAAGVLSSADWVNKEENPPSYREAFKIIYETPNIPRMFVMVSSTLDSDFREQLKQELLSMHKHEEGTKALANYQINRFLPLTPQAVEVLKEIALLQ